MINVTDITWIGSMHVLSLYGLATDTKPLATNDGPAIVDGYEVTNGSGLMLSDKTYWKYDKENNKWDKL